MCLAEGEQAAADVLNTQTDKLTELQTDYSTPATRVWTE